MVGYQGHIQPLLKEIKIDFFFLKMEFHCQGHTVTPDSIGNINTFDTSRACFQGHFFWVPEDFLFEFLIWLGFGGCFLL